MAGGSARHEELYYRVCSIREVKSHCLEFPSFLRARPSSEEWKQVKESRHTGDRDSSQTYGNVWSNTAADLYLLLPLCDFISPFTQHLLHVACCVFV